MGIQINGITDDISAVDGGLTISDLDINQSGISTFNAGLNIGTGSSIFSPATNILTFGTNSNEKLRIESGGNIGIGTNNPNNLLHVYGGEIKAQSNPTDTTTNLDLIRAQCGSTGNALFSVRAADAADNNSNWDIKTNANEDLSFTIGGATEKLRITSAGNLGIGTDNPASNMNLHVLDKTDRCYVTFESGGNESSQLWLKNPARTWKISNYYDQNSLTFTDDSDERLRIDSDGNVGIGTTNPTTNLHIVSDKNALIKLVSTDAYSGIQFIDPDTGAKPPNIYGVGDDFTIWTDWTERFRIDSSGTLKLNQADSMIMTNADTSRLRLFGGSSNSVNNGGALTLHGVSHSSGNYTDLAAGTSGHIQFRVGTSEKLRILSSGGITFNGDTATANALDDYEEGSWTPTLANLNVASHGTVHYATYTKIGRQVTIRISFTISSSVNDNSGVGFNLPFIPSSGERVVLPAISDRSGTNKAPFAMINVNETQYVYAKTLEGYSFQAYNLFSSNYIVCTGTYESA